MRWIEDAMVAGGAICVCVGVALWSIPAAVIVGGVLLITAGAIIGYVHNRQSVR